jgi:hypothetical protein
MNIFHTDSSPSISAKNLDDIRVNKMIIESASLLANAIAFHGGTDNDLPIAKTSNKPFKTKAWQNHPSCLWVKQSKSNYLWLLEHTMGLIEELKFRKKTTHSMLSNINILTNGASFIPDGPLSQFANCTPYKQIGDAVMAYKMTMAYKWQHDAKLPLWTNRSQPDWYNDALIEETRSTVGEFVWTGERLSRSKRDKGWLTNAI